MKRARSLYVHDVYGARMNNNIAVVHYVRYIITVGGVYLYARTSIKVRSTVARYDLRALFTGRFKLLS